MAKKKEKPTKEINVAKHIKQCVDDAVAQTTTWETNNVKWHKMRMRIKKAKNFPFVGCSNLRMPTIEIKLRKLKSALMNVIYGIRPIVQVIPTPSGSWDQARNIEKFLDHLIMDVIKLKPTSIIAIDQMLEKGFYCLKPYFKTEIVERVEEYSLDDLSIQEAEQLYDLNTPPEAIAQAIVSKFTIDTSPLVAKANKKAVLKAVQDIFNGKQDIKIVVQDVICNYPDVALAAPEKVYVSPDTGYNPQNAEYIVHEFDLPLETVKSNAFIKGWDIGEIADIQNIAGALKDKSGSTSVNSKQIDDEKDLREGVTNLNKNGKVRIWEYFGWYDLEGKGSKTKCVVTLAPDFNKVLRKISLPYYSGRYPFVKLFYELTDDRWFSHRGVPELIEDVVKEIDIQHMQKIDQQTIRNTPLYVHRAGMVNNNAMQFVFGQSLPVHGMQSLNDVIAPLNNSNSNVEYSYEREQMILETKVEELIGQIDFSLQSMINKREPRTLGEVQLQQQNMQQVFSLDADQCRMAHEELFNWIWELWCQYGDDTYEFMYFGKETPQGQSIKLNKEEVQGKYTVTIRGNDQNTNPQVRLQKAQMVMMAMNNQQAMQMGVIKPYHIAEAYKLMYQELDVPNPERLVEDPQVLYQQMMAQMKAQQQTPPPDDIKLKGDDLTDAEVAQLLKRRGINPDAAGRALRKQQELTEKVGANG